MPNIPILLKGRKFESGGRLWTVPRADAGGTGKKAGVTFDINKKMSFRGYQTAQTTQCPKRKNATA
jgi:hypothetical protein